MFLGELSVYMLIRYLLIYLYRKLATLWFLYIGS